MHLNLHRIRHAMQERLWKRTAARVFACAAAAAARKGGLRPTPLGEALRQETAKASARVRRWMLLMILSTCTCYCPHAFAHPALHAFASAASKRCWLAGQEEETKSRRERMNSSRTAGTSGKDSIFADLDTNGGMLCFFYDFLACAFRLLLGRASLPLHVHRLFPCVVPAESIRCLC